jgi:hypothetical protein
MAFLHLAEEVARGKPFVLLEGEPIWVPGNPYHLVEWTIKKVLFERKYPGYVYRREVIDGSDWEMDDLTMTNCYTAEDGSYVGDPRTARFLFKKLGLTSAMKSKPDHTVCSIGFHEDEQKWYGWSHRAYAGFGIGDKVFEENYGDDDTPFVQHGSRVVKTLDDAKEAAIAFADSVS